MSEKFEPNFLINFDYPYDIVLLIADFKKQFRNLITWWQDWRGKTEDCWISFNTERGYNEGWHPYPFKLEVSAKSMEDKKAQDDHIAFAKSVVRFLEAKDCKIEFNGSFSIQD